MRVFLQDTALHTFHLELLPLAPEAADNVAPLWHTKTTLVKSLQVNFPSFLNLN